MILVDVNVLIAVHRADHPQHAVALDWFQRQILSSDDPFWVPDVVWASFIRIATNRRFFPVPTPAAEAFAFLHAIRAQPNHIDLTPTPRHLELFDEICTKDDAVGDLAADAYLAALALEHHCEVISFDRDFARFSALTWRRPG